MANLIYDRGFDASKIIGHHDIKIKQAIQQQLGPSDAFINTTWIEYDDELQSLLAENPNRIVFYSGPDWENTSCRRSVHEKIKHNNKLFVGNSRGKFYFSYWLDFVYEYLDKYQTFDPYSVSSNLRAFMCLNRKPHDHRVYLMEKLKPYYEYGYVSLGTEDNPIVLKDDVHYDDFFLTSTFDNAVITNDITSLGHPLNWNSHFLNIVTETTTHTDVFISEKIFKPIIGRRPFVILGDDNVYPLLHENGIDTFDDLFGTGYDCGEWWRGRPEWIVGVVDTIVKDKHLTTLLKKLKPRLEANYHAMLAWAENNRRKINDLGI